MGRRWVRVASIGRAFAGYVTVVTESGYEPFRTAVDAGWVMTQPASTAQHEADVPVPAPRPVHLGARRARSGGNAPDTSGHGAAIRSLAVTARSQWADRRHSGVLDRLARRPADNP